jgi:hypothetical protein
MNKQKYFEIMDEALREFLAEGFLNATTEELLQELHARLKSNVTVKVLIELIFDNLSVCEKKYKCK